MSDQMQNALPPPEIRSRELRHLEELAGGVLNVAAPLEVLRADEHQVECHGEARDIVVLLPLLANDHGVVRLLGVPLSVPNAEPSLEGTRVQQTRTERHVDSIAPGPILLGFFVESLEPSRTGLDQMLRRL